MGRPKKIAKILAYAIALYAGTLVFYIAIVFPLARSWVLVVMSIPR